MKTVAPAPGGVVHGMEELLLCNRNHSRCALDQRLAAFIRDKYATAPARIKAPIGAGDDGLDDKDIAFFDQHVSVARAAILRRKKRAVVAVTAPMHQHQTLQAALFAEAVDEVHEFSERLAGCQMLQSRII